MTKLTIPRVILYTYILIFIDRVITSLYWDFESNPIILSVGMLGMWFIPLIMLPFIVLSFALIENSVYRIYADMCSYFLFVLYLFVVLTNIGVIVL